MVAWQLKVLLAVLCCCYFVDGGPQIEKRDASTEDDHCLHFGTIVPVGYTVDSDCGKCRCTADKGLVCRGCLECSYKGITYKHDATWWNLCNECNCFNSTITCMEKTCPDTCEFNGVTYSKGETWLKDCNTCTCTSEGAECEDTVCSCTYQGETKIHQENWQVDNGDWCVCLSGSIIGVACMFDDILDILNF